MINPYRGILLNGKYYNYESESFRKAFQLRNSVENTQADRSANAIGSSWSTFTLQIAIDSTYMVREGNVEIGETFWLGVSRLYDLERDLGAAGASNPILFVSPYGVTYSVIGTGVVDSFIFNPTNPGTSSGVEFRTNITLEQV